MMENHRPDKLFGLMKDSVDKHLILKEEKKDKVGFSIPNGDNVNKGLSDTVDVTFEQDKNGKWSPVIGGEALKGQSGATLFSDTELNKGDYEYSETLFRWKPKLGRFRR